MNEWNAGNKPPFTGWYWVTVNEAGNMKMYDTPMRYSEGAWSLNGKNYYAANIVAFKDSHKPSEPYIESHIGFPNQFYIRVKCNGIIRYLSKGLQSVKWSKDGYSTKEKAKAAARRLKHVEPEYGYQEQKTEIVVVNGNGEEV